MGKHIVTNVSDGARVVNANPPMILQSGESTPEAIEIDDGELKGAKATGYFEFGASAAKAAASGDDDDKPKGAK